MLSETMESRYSVMNQEGSRGFFIFCGVGAIIAAQDGGGSYIWHVFGRD